MFCFPLQIVSENTIFTNCGAKLLLFLESTKYFLYFCTKY